MMKILEKIRYKLIREKFIIIMTKSYYDVLGITPDATLEEIKDAYIKKSLELHPVNSKKDPKAF